MKYSFVLLFSLAFFWLTASGFFNGFLLSMGALSCFFAVWISRRMGIVDEECIPLQIGILGIMGYSFWLAKRIALSNIALIKIITSRTPQLKRAIFKFATSPKTPIGKVIMANSITLTPGTVTTSIEAEGMQIHALVNPGLEDPTILEIDRRVRALEGI